MERQLRFLLFCVLLLLAACDTLKPAETPVPISNPTASPTRRPIIIPTTPAGWTPYSRSTFQIALPDSWQEVKLSEQELKATVASAQENNPQLAEQLRVLLESGQYQAFVFYAIEPQGTGAGRNVSISRIELEGTNDLTAFVQAYAAELPNAVRGSKLVEVQSPLQVNSTRAAAIVYDLSLVDEQGNLKTVRGVQYLYQLDSGDAYLVTVSGELTEEAEFMPLAREIATTFVGLTP